jgi:hypothetical protein
LIFRCEQPHSLDLTFDDDHHDKPNLTAMIYSSRAQRAALPIPSSTCC